MSMRSTMVLSLQLLAVATLSNAQVPAGDISGGWSFVYLLEKGLQNRSVPTGFFGGGAARINEWIGVAGEVGWNRWQEEFGYGPLTPPPLPYLEPYRGELTQSFTSFTGGPRFYFKQERVTLFLHVLAGGIRIERSQTKFLIQPGGGVDIGIFEKVAIRLQADLQKFFFEDYVGNLRFAAGIVAYLGEK